MLEVVPIPWSFYVQNSTELQKRKRIIQNVESDLSHGNSPKWEKYDSKEELVVAFAVFWNIELLIIGSYMDINTMYLK